MAVVFVVIGCATLLIPIRKIGVIQARSQATAALRTTASSRLVPTAPPISQIADSTSSWPLPAHWVEAIDPASGRRLVRPFHIFVC